MTCRSGRRYCTHAPRRIGLALEPLESRLLLNSAPTLDSLVLSAAQVSHGATLTLSANGVADSDGSVFMVAFYRDANGDGLWDSADETLGTDTSSGGGWRWSSPVPSSWGNGPAVLFARAMDTEGAWSDPASQTLTVSANLAPTVEMLTATPGTLHVGQTITLTAGNVDDPEGALRKVAFYRDTDADGLWDSSDEYLGSDFSAGGGWTWSATAPSSWAGAGVTFFARAMDEQGAWSNAVADSVDVQTNSAPTIESLTTSPDPVAVGSTLSLTANNVTDPDNSVIRRVEFYRDSDGDALWSASDELLGYDTAASWVWSGTVSSGWGEGTATFFVRALDDEGLWSAAVSQQATLAANQAPVIGSLTASPDPVTIGATITLRADNVVDPENYLRRVEFYRDANGNGVWDAADALLGVSTSGWAWSGVVGTAWGEGSVTFFARAMDWEGAWGDTVSDTALLVPNEGPTIDSLTASPDPASVAGQLTLTANSVADAEGGVRRVAFYRDSNANGSWDEADDLIGDDMSASGGWATTWSAPSSWAGTDVRFFARAMDYDGNWGDAVSDTATIQALAPTDYPTGADSPLVGSLSASPDPVLQTQTLTLTAGSVSDPGGSVAAVRFFRDSNGNGAWDASDEVLGEDTSSSGGWVWSDPVPSSWGTGTARFFARAVDNEGNWSSAATATALVQANSPPALGTLSGSPDPVWLADQLTLTVDSVSDADGSVLEVAFYRDSNANGVYDAADERVGADTSGSGGWRWTGYASSSWGEGNVSFFARAVDDKGAWSDPAATTVKVNANLPPTVGSLAGPALPVLQGATIVLTAQDVVDPDGTLWRVAFYRDSNANGVYDAADEQLGYDTYSGGGWTWSNAVPTAWGTGAVRFFARAMDNKGDWGAAASATFTVSAGGVPTIESLSTTPQPVMIGQTLTLSANNVTDPEGLPRRVVFYRDSNGNDIWDAADDSIGAYRSYTVWTAAAPVTSAWGVGTVTVFARAMDDDGMWSAPVSATVDLTEDQAPTIASLVGTPDPLLQGDTLTLTANSIMDAEGEYRTAFFYRDSNGNGFWDAGDEMLYFRRSTSSWAFTDVIPSSWSAGTQTFFVRAMDDDGNWSAAASDTVTVAVNSAPVIDSLDGTPYPVTHGQTYRLTANNVSDAEGAVNRVLFFRDSNANGQWDTQDEVLGADTSIGGGWTWSGGASVSWGVGTAEFFARALDSRGAWSAAASASAVVMSVDGDEFEDDDVAADASAITTDGAVQLHSIHAPGDVDWVTFELTEASDVVIELNGPAGDTELSLYGPDDPANLIAYDDDGGSGAFSRVVRDGPRFLEPGTYHVKVNEYGNDASIDLYSLTVTASPSLWYVGSFTSGGTTVTLYDTLESGDISADAVSVKFGKGGAVKSIELAGDRPMTGLGIVISGAPSVRSIKDKRTGASGELAFIASDAAIGSVKLGSGMTGYNLNGLSLGGLDFAADIDGDGNTGDATALYDTGPVVATALAGDTTGDVWIGGADAQGMAFMSFRNKTGGYHGDFWALGNGGAVRLGGDFASSLNVAGSLTSFQVKGGNFAGDLNVGDSLGKLNVRRAGGQGGRFCAGANVTVVGLFGSGRVGAYETDNGAEVFGLFAGSFGKLALGGWKLRPPDLPFVQGDLRVQLV